MQSYLARITIPSFPYTTEGMLTTSIIFFITDQDECARHSSLNSQVLGIMNLFLAHNIFVYRKTSAEFLWNYLYNKYGSSGPAAVFIDYQCTRHFQISGNSNSASQIAELNTFNTRLERNYCNVLSLVCAITLLFAIPQSWNNLATSILTS